MAIESNRIAKNTMTLYLRMILLLLISLYTSRVVLAALGESDFGTYNVVGGVVAVLGFLMGTLNTASSRFITVALGTSDAQEMRKTFSNVFMVNVILLSIVIVLAETIGLWFLLNKLNIPEGRMTAAFWVYQFSVITVIISFIQVSFTATVIAHERMDIFAYISLFDGFARLGISLLIGITKTDRLIFYGFCLLLIQVIDFVVYWYYCHVKFDECKISLQIDKSTFRKILSFISWSAYGSFVSIGITEGLNIVINLFFGITVNAARAVAVQVQGAVAHFTTNFQTAINPQLIKSTSQKDFVSACSLFLASSKFSFFLLCIVGIPIIIEAQYILSLWLIDVPDYACSFCQIMIVISIWGCLANPLRVVNQAEGNIKKFQLYECTILLLIIPVAYCSLKIWAVPILVFVVHFVFDNVAQIVRLLIVLPKIELSLGTYFKNVYLRLLPIFIFPFIPGVLINNYIEIGMPRLVLNFFVVEIVLFVGIWYFGMKENERELLKGLMAKIIKRR